MNCFVLLNLSVACAYIFPLSVMPELFIILYNIKMSTKSLCDECFQIVDHINKHKGLSAWAFALPCIQNIFFEFISALVSNGPVHYKQLKFHYISFLIYNFNKKKKKKTWELWGLAQCLPLFLKLNASLPKRSRKFKSLNKSTTGSKIALLKSLKRIIAQSNFSQHVVSESL